MLSHFINSLTNANVTTLQETITSFRLVYRCSIGNSQPINDICFVLQGLSVRDNFELHIEAGGALFTVHRLPVDEDELAEFALEAHELGEIKVSLDVRKKKVDDTISIYSISAFENYLTSVKLPSILATFSNLLEKTLHFEVKDNIVEFATHTLSFSQGQNSSRLPIVGRNSIISNFKESSSFSGVNGFSILPNDFHFREFSGRNILDKFFLLTCGTISLAYLSNVSELNSNGDFSFRMYGYKAVIVDGIDSEYVIRNAPMLYKIYRWVYDTDNVADRLGLARNVISLHLDSSGLPILSQAVWDAIHSNYQIYLKGNIESYLEVKGKIAELLMEAISKTNQMAENLLDSLKNNALIIITFFLTVVVINGVKDLSVNAIFSVPYAFIVAFLIISSWIWMDLLRKDVLDRFKTASDTLANILRTNYGGVLLADEINRSVQPAIADNEAQLKKQINKYSSWWRRMLGSFAFLYIVGFLIFGLVLAERSDKKNIIDAESKAKVENDKSKNFPNQTIPERILPRRIGPEI